MTPDADLPASLRRHYVTIDRLPEAEQFGRRLKTIRTLRGVGQRWLARETGVSYSFICQLETGKTTPSAVVLKRLADVLGYSMDDLWTGTGRCEEMTT